MQRTWKNKNSNQQHCLHIKRKKLTVFYKNIPSQNIVPHLMYIIWNFITIFLIEYSSNGIVKPNFDRRNKK